jgi:hypothetical protein
MLIFLQRLSKNQFTNKKKTQKPLISERLSVIPLGFEPYSISDVFNISEKVLLFYSPNRSPFFYALAAIAMI